MSLTKCVQRFDVQLQQTTCSKYIASMKSEFSVIVYMRQKSIALYCISLQYNDLQDL